MNSKRSQLVPGIRVLVGALAATLARRSRPPGGPGDGAGHRPVGGRRVRGRFLRDPDLPGRDHRHRDRQGHRVRPARGLQHRSQLQPRAHPVPRHPESPRDRPDDGCVARTVGPVDVTTYEVNGLYGFGAGRTRGYMGLGVGAMTLHPLRPGRRDGGGHAVHRERRPRREALPERPPRPPGRRPVSLQERPPRDRDGRLRKPRMLRLHHGSLLEQPRSPAGVSYRFGGPRIWDLPDAPASPTSTAVLASPSRRPAPKERFFAAAGEIAPGRARALGLVPVRRRRRTSRSSRWRP